MTPDEIITEYEGLWRQAALENRKHVSAAARGLGLFEGENGEAVCAASIRTRNNEEATSEWWAVAATAKAGLCPECEHPLHCLGALITHLNDIHLWTWDRLAGKFRDAWEQGLVRAAEARR